MQLCPDIQNRLLQSVYCSAARYMPAKADRFDRRVFQRKSLNATPSQFALQAPLARLDRFA